MDWSRLRTELLWAYCGTPDMPYTEHCHEHPVLMCWLILKGNVQAYSPSCGPIKAHAGQWLFIPMDKKSHCFSKDAQIISLRLVIQWPDEQHLYNHDRWIIIADTDHPQLQKQARRLAQKIDKIVQANPQEKAITHMATFPCSLSDYLTIEQATLKWVQIYDRVMQKMGIKRSVITQMDKRVSQCIRHIEQLPPSRDFDEKQLARSLGLSAGQLNRLFSQCMQMTPKAYAENLRLNDAIKLLTSTSLPIKELTFQLGFKQQSHFANWFLKKTGIYPRDYRLAYRKPPLRQVIDTFKTG